MKQLMYAIEAKRAVDKCLDKASEVLWDEIVDGINEAINKGRYDYSFDGRTPDNIRSKLIRLGYDIRSGVQYNVPWTVISWKDIHLIDELCIKK